MNSSSRFSSSITHRNFWGPSDKPPFKLEENFQEYSKSDKIGKIADWISPQDKKCGVKSLGPYQFSNIYSNAHEDEGDFTLMNSTKAQRNQTSRGRGKYITPRYRLKNEKQRGTYNTRYSQGRGKKSGYGNRGRYGDRYHNTNYWFRKPSVLVRDTWKLIEELDYPRLSRMRIPTMPKPTDMYQAGSVLAYDKAYDNIRSRNPQPLKPSQFVFHKVPTTDDPIIRTSTSKACVFASDSILSTLMACTRSVAPWDLLIHRVANVLFFDKRPDSDIELLTVNETSNDPGFDHNINSPAALSLEASTVNQFYSQQCLIPKTFQKSGNRNPFFENQSDPNMPSVVYKYRLFDLGDDIKVMVRCEYDAYSQHDNCCINVKSLLEWGTKPTMSNWREDLESLSGSILATEIKNNSNKFAKWTASAILAGDNLMKIGNHSLNNKEHSVIGSVSVASRDLVTQIGLKMDNAWGIVHYLSKTLLALPEGKYVLMKDPHKSALRLYGVSDSAVNSNDEMDEESDSESDSKNIHEPSS
ncbi:hypothetical protein MXB_3846 [Myxobolus squamalis]|nr:hypothetical protein MXB_3846 [Myxobolus squamalis]